MSGSLAIDLEAVSKHYTIYVRRAGGLKDKIVSRLTGRPEVRETLWALKDVSLSAERGATLGIIGANGCGKSTLLQIIAGILQPDGGRIAVDGRVTSLLELGAGFSPDLSGRENVYLNASLHGVPRQVIDQRFDEIVAFSGLEAFIDSPVRNYSSGMYMRLGFSVAAHLDPEIVLIDEAFAVGDEQFQRKCLRKIHDFKAQGVTIVIVSHDLLLVERLSTHVCLLDRGRVRTFGPASEAIARYHQLAAGGDEISSEIRWGTREVTITGVRILDERGQDTRAFKTGDTFRLLISYGTTRAVASPIFGLALFAENGTHLTGPNTQMNRYPIPLVNGAGEIEYTVRQLPLLPGQYAISVSVYDESLLHAYDHRNRVVTFAVVEGGSSERFGLITLSGEWTLKSRAQVESN
ncbi:MAG: ATP-binding cassette domain-containing protein [Luteitalea sp.]|nr:ATP-binding cassette domain-containing protein [Luteitalea sp.]